MRIKTAPKHRLVRTSTNGSNDSHNAIDLTNTPKKDKKQSETADTVISVSPNASSSENQELNSGSEDNITNGESACEHNSEDDKSSLSSKDDNNNVEAIDLSTKDWQQDVEEQNICTSSGEPEDKFKDTFLYKIMTDPSLLESIQQRSKQTKKFECPFCKKEFSSNEDLEEHMDIKMDESNQAVCCACNKIFAQKRYLRYHQRCHSERTKFTCDICTKKYTRLDNLSRHNAFHVNPGKFSCTGCEKTFTRKDLLNKHRKCHENKYRFYCVECVRYFKGQITLDNHKKLFHTKSLDSTSE